MTYTSGHHKTELDLVRIRTQQQQKPALFVVRMNWTTPNKIVGRKTIKWRKCKGGVDIEYMERVTATYDELWRKLMT